MSSTELPYLQVIAPDQIGIHNKFDLDHYGQYIHIYDIGTTKRCQTLIYNYKMLDILNTSVEMLTAQTI